MKIIPAIFEEREIRRAYDETTETWFFSVVDIIQVLTQQPDYQAARNYWKVLKNRLTKEGSQSVTNCNRLKLPAAAFNAICSAFWANLRASLTSDSFVRTLIKRQVPSGSGTRNCAP